MTIAVRISPSTPSIILPGLADFVLIHGAWLGGWCWEPHVRELERRGHRARAPDLPSDDPVAGFAEWAAAVAARADEIVVAHSFSGVLLPLLDARAHVYLCAFVPVPGRAAAELYSDVLDPGFGGTERDELGRTFWPSVDAAAERLFAGHAREWAEWAFPQLRPQAQTVAQEPSPLSAFSRTPAAYVLARHDPSIRPEWSREAARSVLGIEPLEIDGGHFPMLDRPAELADLLERALEELS